MVLAPVNKLRLFQLLFSDPGRLFYSSGEKLSGSVRLEAAQPCRVTRLMVTAAGCARVEHRGGKNRKARSQEVEYIKYEEELRLEEVLSKGEVEEVEEVLLRGVQTRSLIIITEICSEQL